MNRFSNKKLPFEFNSKRKENWTPKEKERKQNYEKKKTQLASYSTKPLPKEQGTTINTENGK